MTSLRRLVRNSPDLSRLINEGYAVRIAGGHLVIDDIPFATAAGGIARGSLICPLDLQGEATTRPSTHVMWFTELPYASDGTLLVAIIHEQGPLQLAEGLVAACSSSRKVNGREYENFYDKVVAYVGLVLGHAQAIDPSVTATSFKPVVSDEEDSVFKYLDTSSSRAGIMALTEKLTIPKVAIVGLGGTGAYLLDFLVKTPIRELHLYDGDVFSTHNAYRSPVAASVEELNGVPFKVHHHAGRYDPLRWGLISHPVYVTSENVAELSAMDFVFLTMDASEDKRVIVKELTRADVPFIDTGVGIRHDPGGLAGLLRVTSSFPGRRDHIETGNLISYGLGDDDEYETNIQVVELNALTAALAVIAFKKRYGFYRDDEQELHTLFRLDSNELHAEYGVGDPEAGDE